MARPLACAAARAPAPAAGVEGSKVWAGFVQQIPVWGALINGYQLLLLQGSLRGCGAAAAEELRHQWRGSRVALHDDADGLQAALL